MKKGFILGIVLCAFTINNSFAQTRPAPCLCIDYTKKKADTVKQKTSFSENDFYFLRGTCTDSAYINSWYYNRTSFTSEDLKKHPLPIRKEH